MQEVQEILWGRKWQPTAVFLPGKSHGQRSLAGYSPWGHKELRLSTPEYSLPSSYGCGLPPLSLHSTHTGHAGRARSQVNGALSFIATIFNSCYHSAKLLLLLLQMGIH